MDAARIHCPKCAAIVPGKDINIAALLAKCDVCSHVFSLPQAGDASATPQAFMAAPSCPSGIVHDTGMGGELYLRRSWFSPGILFLLLFCVIWDGFLIVWYSIALFGGKGGGGWMMLVFPLGHVAVGVALTYFVVASLLNKTQILVDGHDVHIRHRPVPWWGNRIMAVADIQGIELDRSVGKNSGDSLTVSGHHVDGRQIVLLSTIPRRQAEFIAYKIAEYLKVPLNRNYNPDSFDPGKILAQAFGALKGRGKGELAESDR